MSLLKYIALCAALTCLASCGNQSAANEDRASAVSSENKVAVRTVENVDLSPPSDALKQAGMYRWASGMQNGIFWAAISNKHDDWLRFFAEDQEEENSPLDWAPNVEIADTATKAKIAKGTVMNFVSGQEVAIFGYEVNGEGDPEIQLLGMDGARNLSRLLEMLRDGNDKPVCVEFPKADYRTCFSTNGAKDVLL